MTDCDANFVFVIVLESVSNLDHCAHNSTAGKRETMLLTLMICKFSCMHEVIKGQNEEVETRDQKVKS